MSTSTDAKKEPGEEPLQHRRSRRGLYVAVAAVVVVVLIVAYVVLSGMLNPLGAHETLSGAGATFPAPLITLWTQQYANISGTPSYGTHVNYQAVGSGTGITDLNNKVVDFGASDAPLSVKDRANNPNLASGAVLHVPETIGAVTFAYNLPGIPSSLNITGPILVQIFLGHITTWNDPNLTALNPGLASMAQPITVVHRSDSSGTSFVWTSYLHLSNPTAWNSSLVGKQINWPVGIAKPGNSGVAGYIANPQDTFSCGYVELAYTIQNSMKVAAIKNAAGSFISPSLDSTAAAAAGAAPTLPAGIGDWANVSILNAPGANSYPVSTFTYLLVYKELNTLGSSETLSRAQALVNFLWWVVHEGQTYSNSLAYVTLPKAVVTLDETSLNSLTFNGQVLVHS